MEKIKSNVLTALILTFNEEDNIRRVLDELDWLERIVVIDSNSTDSTIQILNEYPNVEVFYRAFDTHATQWNFGLLKVESEWVLTLDADYVLKDDFKREIKSYVDSGDKVAYLTNFKFLIFGKPLVNDNTTPRPVLFKKEKCTYYDDGHTQRLKINGETSFFKSIILHDDRKSLSRWLKNQDGYSIKECNKLLNPGAGDKGSLIVKVRKSKVLAPFFVFFYCLFFKGLIFNGWTGWYYTLQRTMVEILFSLRLIEEENLKKKV